MVKEKNDYTRINLTGLPEETCKAFEKLAEAKGMNYKQCFIYIVQKAYREAEENRLFEKRLAIQEKKKEIAKLEKEINGE